MVVMHEISILQKDVVHYVIYAVVIIILRYMVPLSLCLSLFKFDKRKILYSSRLINFVVKW